MQNFTLNLNAKLQPMHRGDIYEDPLHDLLAAQNLGGTTGGGTLMEDNGEVANCDVEIELSDDSDSVDKLVAIVNDLGVPKGSKLLAQDISIEVGSLEGLAVYFDGTSLPDHVYEECDINVALAALNERMEGLGHHYSYWTGPTETAIYFYGASFEAMKNAALPFINEYPLCENARLVQIA